MIGIYIAIAQYYLYQAVLLAGGGPIGASFNNDFSSDFDI